MFQLNENYEVDRRILKCDFITYSPAETSTIITPKSQIYINIPKEVSVISLLNSYLDLNSEVTKKADNSRHANDNDIKVNNLGSIAFFSKLKLTTYPSKHLEDISHAHIVPSVYKLMTSAKDSDDLSIGFDRSRDRRKEKLINNKNLKSKHLLKIMLEDNLGFDEHLQKATYGLGFKLTLTRNKDDAIIDRPPGIADVRIKIDHIHW